MTPLRDPFDHTFEKGGFTYVSWSQVADRLDDHGEPWSFAVMAIGPDWVHGRLTIGERHYENVGYAENAEADWKKEPLKDAVSDALKRCAALAGVGRYLYDKDAPPARPASRPQLTSVPRSTTALPPDDDIDFESLPTTKPGVGGKMWTKDLLSRAEARGIDVKAVGEASKRMYGKDAWRIASLTDEQRHDLAAEMGLL